MTTASSGARVLITSRVVEQSEAAMAQLTSAGCKLVENPQGGQIDGATLTRLLQQSDGLIVGTQTVNAETLAGAPALRAIVKAGAGIDNIDADAATKRGIRVTATAGANAEAVADYTFAMLLAAARKIVDADRSVREGKWARFTGVDAFGKTLGIVGLGHIGRGVARRAAGFSMRVLAYDIQYDQEFLKAVCVLPTGLDSLLAQSDFVSLHAPRTPSGGFLIGREQIAQMKRGAILVNTARGGLVDETALYEALREGQLAGAALDVFEQEPPGASPLKTLGNVVLSPHNASYSTESMSKVAESAVSLLLGLLEETREAKHG